MMAAYSRVAEVEDSTWLMELRAAADRTAAAVPTSRRHLLVYFDHVGCWEFVAEDVEVRADLGFAASPRVQKPPPA
jgi:hypothetical protein